MYFLFTEKATPSGHAQKASTSSRSKTSKENSQEKSNPQNLFKEIKNTLKATRQSGKVATNKVVVSKNVDNKKHLLSRKKKTSRPSHRQKAAKRKTTGTKKNPPGSKALQKKTESTQKSASRKLVLSRFYAQARKSAHPKTSWKNYVMKLLQRRILKPAKSSANARKTFVKSSSKSIYSPKKSRHQKISRIHTSSSHILHNLLPKVSKHFTSKSTSLESRKTHAESKSSKTSNKQPFSTGFKKSPSASLKVIPSSTSCQISSLLTDHSFRYGTKAGHFTYVGKYSRIDGCASICCKDLYCDIALLVNQNCYKVQCHGMYCQTVPIKHLGFHSKLAFIARSSGKLRFFFIFKLVYLLTCSSFSPMHLVIVIFIDSFMHPCIHDFSIYWYVCLFVRSLID